jgi:hypothetical protein
MGRHVFSLRSKNSRLWQEREEKQEGRKGEGERERERGRHREGEGRGRGRGKGEERRERERDCVGIHACIYLHVYIYRNIAGLLKKFKTLKLLLKKYSLTFKRSAPGRQTQA